MSGPSVFYPENLTDGPWVSLLKQAYKLIDGVIKHSGVADPFWTLGGGTVLMFRYRHRRSKDIDVFVPDPQYLGYVNPRLSDLAAEVSQDYVETAAYVKLIRTEGEIDFVASQNLTQHPFEWWYLAGRVIRVETAAEIVAKKLWHRGDAATARDIFDLSLVIEKDPDVLKTAAAYLIRHRGSFFKQLRDRERILKTQFDAIDTLDYRPDFQHARLICEKFLSAL